MNIRRSIATVGTAGVLATGSLFLASPAQAAGPVITGGLVNVTIVDAADVVIRDIDVALAAALNIGANVCGVQAAVLAADFAADNVANCTNELTGRSVAITR